MRAPAASPAPLRTILIRVGERELPLVVRRNRRARRMILRLDHHGEAATVTLPPQAAEAEAVALAARSKDWLAARLATLPARVPFAAGAEVPLLGKAYRIVTAPAARTVSVRDDAIIVGGAPEKAARRLGLWFRQRAREELSRRAKEKAARIGRAVARISVRDPVSRWGSCSATGTLSFSWRLIMAPPLVLDYVVAHEVAHLVVAGHGPQFWAAVRTLTDATDEARAWLRREGITLHRYG